MREMVLNHASLAGTGSPEAVRWLVDLAAGMSELTNHGVVGTSLRLSEHQPDGFGLAALLHDFRQQGQRDSYVFLARLSTKISLWSGVAEDVRDRFRACEAMGCGAISLHPADGEPLVFCAISDGITVGRPTESIWDRDRLTVHFRELLPDGSIEDASERIDNLTRSTHAALILQRHRDRVRRKCSTGADLWRRRREIFPRLLFGPEVEGQVNRINVLGKVMRRLAELDESAASWVSGPTPDWLCDVRTESRTVMDTPKLREARRFRSVTGNRDVFPLHASFGKGGRIHLRVDAAQRQVEIGYIGGHLPTKRFRR